MLNMNEYKVKFKNRFSKIFGVLQRMGRALMLPIALLPAAGILLGIGMALQETTLIHSFPILGNDVFQKIAEILAFSGQIVFDNLPLLFAVGVAIGFSNGDGVAALAAIIGYLVMNKTIGTVLNISPELAVHPMRPEYTLAIGVPTLQTGVFGGIIVGLVASSMYNKFYKITLPEFLGFFSGKRFVPIVTAVASVFLGILMSYLWPIVQTGMNNLSYFVMERNELASAFIFGVTERGLVPFGLHHIFYSPFWYEFGSYITDAGRVVRGDQRIFFAQLADNSKLTAGIFMTGKFPFMMFGLPAAALAMYHEVKIENRRFVAGIYASAALTSFTTGITEPLEFLFLFTAPFLYLIHMLFAGLSFLLMDLFHVKIGMTFSGGVIDFILFGVMQGKTPWWNVIIVGLGFSIIYYFGFRFAIRTFNIQIPGREEGKATINTNVNRDVKTKKVAEEAILALGGTDNILQIDSCITRLRIELKNIKKLDKSVFYKHGAKGVLIIGDNVQVIFGTKSEILKTEITKMMETPTQESNTIQLLSPTCGTLLNLRNVPDKVFSQKLMGEGFAIIPSSNDFYAPIDGIITNIFPTKHAIEISGTDKNRMLIHVGIDTIYLKGEGFTVHVEKNQEVKRGDLILSIDLKQIKRKVPSIITPIILFRKDLKEIEVDEGTIVTKGEIISLTDSIKNNT